MAENINAALEEIGFENLGVKARPGLVVLRRTQMPALLVEVGFINSDTDNALFDDNLEAIAKAIAYGILETLDVENVMTENVPTPRQMTQTAAAIDAGAPEEPTLYRVQVGLFRQRQNADNLLYELQEKGYPAFILAEDGFYKVQVGAYQQLGNAIIMERRLRREGYSTLITT